jgi:uncharacterized RDD family membrane protein YckC
MSARVEKAAARATSSSSTAAVAAPPIRGGGGGSSRGRGGRVREVIVNFDAARVKAPFLLRCGALLIDYIILIALPVLGLLLAEYSSGDSGTKLFKNPLNSAGWLVALLLAATNFVVFPMIGGQSVGKFLTGLRIINKDGRAAGFAQLLLRHLAGYPLTILTLGLGFLWSAFNSKGRALHDLVAGTIVVYGQKKPKAIAIAAAAAAAASDSASVETPEKKDYSTQPLNNEAVKRER